MTDLNDCFKSGKQARYASHSRDFLHAQAWQGFDAIEVTNAKYIDTAPETLRGDVFHIWILGYQFVDTIMLYTKQNNTLYMLLSKKKSTCLKQIFILK